MKIIELRAENIKKLVAVTIRPNGNLVEITGKNGQGKTSVLDAIWWALEGQKNIQAVPIRKGATSAKIRLDLGELKITRTFSQAKDKETKELTDGYTTSIIVENGDGARFPSPQSVIDNLLGALSFDPLAFTRMKPADQFETLKRFVPGVDFSQLDKMNENDFRIRTDVNRQVKELRARESAIVVDETLPEPANDEGVLIHRLEAAGKQNAAIEKKHLERKQAQDLIDRLKKDLATAEKSAAELKKRIADLNDLSARLQDSIKNEEQALATAAPIEEPVSTTEIREQLERARETTRRLEANQRAKAERAKLAAAAVDAEKCADDLTRAMEARKKAKADAIAAAKMPVPGIGFGDGVVLLNGVPFEQASDAEQLRASIAIAAAMNPKLRVIRVRDGSLLDDDALKLLGEFADASDMQVWIERVDSSGKVGFVLEDGQVRESVDALA